MSWHPTRDARELAAPFPDRGHLVERRHGRALGPAGPLAGGLGLAGSPPPCCSSDCSTSPWSAASSSLERRPHEISPAAAPRLVVVACVSLAMTGSHLTFRYDIGKVHAHLPPSTASYLGVFEPGVPPTTRPTTHNSRGYGMGNSPTWLVITADGHSPSRHHSRTSSTTITASRTSRSIPAYASVSDVAAGTYDDYLRTYADSVRDFGHPVVIGFGHEMNAPWYSWGYGHSQARDIRGRLAARRLGSSGTKAQIMSPGCGPSTRMALKPAPSRHGGPATNYVTWVGIDGYYVRASRHLLDSVFGPTISQVRKITEQAHSPVRDRRQALTRPTRASITNLFNGWPSTRMLGLVWFDYKQ